MKHIIILISFITMAGYCFSQTDKSRKKTIIEDIQVSTLPLESPTSFIEAIGYLIIDKAVGITMTDGMPLDSYTLDRLFLDTEMRVAVTRTAGRQSKCF